MPPTENKRQAVHITYQPKIDFTRECLSVRPEEVESIEPGLGAMSRICLHYLKDLPIPCTGSAAARGLQNCCEEMLRLIDMTRRKLCSKTTDMKHELRYLRSVTHEWTKFFKCPDQTPSKIHSELEHLRSENEQLKAELDSLKGKTDVFRKQAILQLNRYAAASKQPAPSSNAVGDVEILEEAPSPRRIVPSVKILPATSVRGAVRVMPRPERMASVSSVKQIPLRPSENEIRLRRVETIDATRNKLFLEHLEEL